LIDVNGTLYGTTFYGGAYGGGTIFSITTTGNESVLYGFGSGFDGAIPLADFLDADGKLYGTTYEGGANGHGIVYSFQP
jgi:uncharacterized repeat protein (TIGR03803 family)